MLAAMGDRDILLMRGHGITVSGGSVEQVTTQAIKFDQLSKIMWDIALSGREPIEIRDEDRERYSAMGRGERRTSGWASLAGSESWTWNYYVEMLRAQNIGLPAS